MRCTLWFLRTLWSRVHPLTPADGVLTAVARCTTYHLYTPIYPLGVHGDGDEDGEEDAEEDEGW